MRKIPVLLGAIILGLSLTAGGVSAYFTDHVSKVLTLKVEGAGVAEVKITESSFDEERAKNIGVGDTVPKDPAIKNTGRKEVYSFIKLTLPGIRTESGLMPVFSYNPSLDFRLIDEKEAEENIERVYAFGDETLRALKKDESTPALFNAVTFVNPAGDNSLSGLELILRVESYAPVAEEVTKSGTAPSGEEIWEMISEPENQNKEYLFKDIKDNLFLPGSFNVKLLSDGTVENAGDLDAFAFIRVKGGSTVSGGRLLSPENGYGLGIGEGWELIKSRGDEYVFSYKEVLKPGEKTTRVFVNVSPETLPSDVAQGRVDLDMTGFCIQAGGLTGKALEEIYALAAGADKEGLFKEESKKPGIFLKPGVEIGENFPAPAPLSVGDNFFVKEVSFKNTENKNRYIRVFIDFSLKSAEDKAMLSSDGGETYVKFLEFKNNLPQGWKYEESGVLQGYYYYETPTEPGKSTPHLFTNVKISYDSPEEIEPFDILIYAQGAEEGALQSYDAAFKKLLTEKEDA